MSFCICHQKNGQVSSPMITLYHHLRSLRLVAILLLNVKLIIVLCLYFTPTLLQTLILCHSLPSPLNCCTLVSLFFSLLSSIPLRLIMSIAVLHLPLLFSILVILSLLSLPYYRSTSSMYVEFTITANIHNKAIWKLPFVSTPMF